MQKHVTTVVGLLVGLFVVGCGAEVEPAATPALATVPATPAAIAQATSTTTPSPAPSNTPVPAPTDTPTEAPTEIPTSEPTVAPTGTPEPAIEPTATPLSGFRRDDSFPPVAVERLWIAPDGRPWALAAAGSYVLTEEGWTPLWPGDVTPLGADAAGRAWAWLDGESTLAFYDAKGWHALGPGLPEGIEATGDPVTGFAVDLHGNAWITRGRDGLWQFDPVVGAWTIWRESDIGFSPPPVSEDAFASYAPTLYFTSVAVDGLGGVWATACPMLIYEDGPIPWQIRDGEGARRFDGETWIGIDMAFDRCLWQVAGDGEGRVWLAGPKNDLWTGANDFLRYGSEAGWETLPVPANEGLFPDRPRFVSQVRFDTDGHPWLWVETRGGASFPAPGLYTSLGGDWITVMDEFQGTVAFGPEGNVWLFGEEAYLTQAGVLNRELLWYRQMIGEVMTVDADQIRPETMVVDGADRVWFVGADGRSLWITTREP